MSANLRPLGLSLLLACGRTEPSASPTVPVSTADPKPASLDPGPFSELKTFERADLPGSQLTPAWTKDHPDAPVPAGVRFVISPTTRLDGHTLVATGYLINETTAPVDLRGYFAFYISFPGGSSIQRRPSASLSPPPPPVLYGLTLPARSRLRFGSSLNLDDYAYPAGGAADVAWQFSPVDAAGVLRAQRLPATGPVGPPPQPLSPG